MSIHNGTNQAASPMRPIDHARSHADGANTAWRKAVGTVRHLDLFGPMVTEAVLRDVESVHEHGSEAAHHYEEALRTEQDRSAAIARESAGLARQVLALRTTIEMAVEDTERRYAKAHRPLPEWAADLRSFLVATSDEEPF